MLTAQLIGAGWRTARLEPEKARAELEITAGSSPVERVGQAAVDAARFWRRRADEGQVDVERARAAADRLLAFSRDSADGEVEPTPDEPAIEPPANEDWRQRWETPGLGH